MSELRDQLSRCSGTILIARWGGRLPRLKQQFDRIDAQRMRETLDHVQRDIATQGFEPIHVDTMEIGLEGELLLAPAEAMAAPSDILGKGRAQCAGNEGLHSRIG